MRWLHPKRLVLLCFTAWTFDPISVTAQEAQTYYQQLIEIITENLEGSEEFDYTELGELIDNWTRQPLDINSSEAILLAQWNIITDFAWQSLQDHIFRNGPLLSLLELQSIRGFDTEIIRILQTIARVEGRDLQTRSIPIDQLFLRGINEVYLRGGRNLQTSKGFEGDQPKYEGSADKLYLRLRHRNGNALSYGFTGEKDAGEALFNGSNPSGFDFNSFHIALQQYRSRLPAVMLGDFSASFGQGLIMHSGFGAGKSSFVNSIKRTGFPLRPYTSVDENNFLRGVGISVRPMDHLTITAFGSNLRRDGNLNIDTVRENGEILDIRTDITSLQSANLHRTEAEIADENAIDLTQGGVSIAYHKRRSHLAVNALHSRLSHPLNRDPDLYNQFYFNGDRLTNVSTDYGVWLGGIHFFGETAISDNGGIATVNGLLAGLDRHLVASVLFRSYAKDYQALSPNVFGEGSLANNETGLYTGLEITPSSRWKVQLYHDIWSHPWLRFNIDSPTEGQEYFARVTYTVKRRLEIYGQYRSKHTARNIRPAGDAIAEVSDQYRTQARLHINNIVHPSLQLRTRLEWTRYTLAAEKQNGFMIYQDFVYKPIASPWSMSGRIMLFDTDDYDTRIYTFENDLIYYYAIPAFSDRGSRFYLNLRYKGIRNLTLEMKYAQTRWLDATSVGSGNDEIPGNKRSEIRAQVIYRFES